MSIRLISDHASLFAKAKWAFSTRRVAQADARGLSHNFAGAKSGDLVLGRVLTVGQHKGVQLTTGRRSLLYPGDLIVAACGARYAPDQFEGVAEIDSESCDLLAGGGCLGRMTLRNQAMKMPTKIGPLGLLAGRTGAPINLSDYAEPLINASLEVPVIAVLGASMNAGKTTAATALVCGLRQAGWSVAALKGTGTGAFGDYNSFVDAGAHYVADLTDAGMVSTYLQPLSRVKAGIRSLLSAATTRGADIVVLEIADGVFQKETAALIADAEFRSWLSGTIFACGDPVAAAGGVAVLSRAGIAPVALTGVLSCSPLSSAEATAATGVEVLSKSELADPAEASTLASALISAKVRVA